MSTFALLAKLNRLNTNERISRWNNTIDQICVLCTEHDEDKDHMFINFIYSRKILKTIIQKLQIDIGNSFDLDNILNIICQAQRGNSFLNHTTNTAFTVVIWNIWCERNSRVSKGINLPEQVS